VLYAALLDLADEIFTTVLVSREGFARDRKMVVDIIKRALETPAFINAE
jgi:hypothetical protein